MGSYSFGSATFIVGHSLLIEAELLGRVVYLCKAEVYFLTGRNIYFYLLLGG